MSLWDLTLDLASRPALVQLHASEERLEVMLDDAALVRHLVIGVRPAAACCCRLAQGEEARHELREHRTVVEDVVFIDRLLECLQFG
jgi:hypothetical protein